MLPLNVFLKSHALCMPWIYLHNLAFFISSCHLLPPWTLITNMHLQVWQHCQQGLRNASTGHFLHSAYAYAYANAVSMQKSALRLPSCQHSYFFFFPPAIINDSIFSIPLEEGLWSARWSRVMWLSHAGVCFWTRRGCVSLQACLCVCLCVSLCVWASHQRGSPEIQTYFWFWEEKILKELSLSLSLIFWCLFPLHIYTHPCISIFVS